MRTPALQKQVRTSDIVYGVQKGPATEVDGVFFFAKVHMPNIVYCPIECQWILCGSGTDPKGIEFRV